MSQDDRPRLTIVATALSPYRLHLHTRIIREIPSLRLESVFLKARNNQPWAFDLPEEIHPVFLDQPEQRGRKLPKAKVRPRYWRQGGRVIEQLRRSRPDVVVITGYHDICRLRVIHWCWRQGIPIYMFTDANVASDRESGIWRVLKKWYVSWVVKKLSGLLVCGSAGEAYYRPYGGARKPNFYVPHETDYEALDALTEAQIRQAREQFGMRDDLKYIVYCGRMARKKRVDLLVDAFAAIAEKRPDWGLLLIGDGELRASLEARLPAALADRVIWAGFVNDRDTIGSLYRASEVFCLPSEDEPWGAVVAEACGAGLAVVCSDVVGAAPELCRDGVNGRQFRSGDVPSLTDALRDVTEPGNLERMRDETRQVLIDWRERGDPIKGIRGMLADAGVKFPTQAKQPSEVVA